MDAIECIKTRRSIRKYKDKPVEWEKIVTILDSGRLTPSAGNLLNMKFVLVREEANRRKLAEAAFKQMWMAKAPVHIVVCAEPEKAEAFYGTRGKTLYTTQNCAAATENMLIAANALGLGSCWVGAFDEDLIRRIVNLPEQAIAHAIVTIGYADETPPMPPRMIFREFIYLEVWWARRRNAPQTWYSLELERQFKKGKKNIKKFAKKLSKKIQDKMDKKKSSTTSNYK